MWPKSPFDNVHPPVIVCGCHGGGTSYVTKLLRWAGWFAGADAGPLSKRKIHESRAYLFCNERILRSLLPGCPGGMRTSDQAVWRRFLAALEEPHRYRQAAATIDLRAIRRQYWGGRSRWQSLYWRYRLRQVPWGWKDPRNSLTLPFWLDLYPEARVLIVTRQWRSGEARGQSRSGSWFRSESTAPVRSLFMNPPALGRCAREAVLRFDLSEVRDLAKLNRLLAWIGLRRLASQAHGRLLRETGFEPSAAGPATRPSAQPRAARESG